MKTKQIFLTVILVGLCVVVVAFGATSDKVKGLLRLGPGVPAQKGAEMFDLHSQSCFEYLPALTLGLRAEGTEMVMPLKTKCKAPQNVCYNVAINQRGLKLGLFKLRHNGADITGKAIGLNNQTVDAGNSKNKVKQNVKFCLDPDVVVEDGDDIDLITGVEPYDTTWTTAYVEYSVEVFANGNGGK